MTFYNNLLIPLWNNITQITKQKDEAYVLWRIGHVTYINDGFSKENYICEIEAQ